MTAGRFMLVVLVFVAGYAAASKTPPCRKTPEPLDISQPIKVVLTSNPHDPESVEFVSHRVVVDGEGHDVLLYSHRHGSEIWRIELARGRVVLFASRRSYE